MFYLVSLWLGGMVAVMVYLLVIPLVVRSQGDFALRCECCPSPHNDGNKVNPEISIIDSKALEQQATAHNFVTPVLAINTNIDEYGFRHPKQEVRFNQTNLPIRSASVPGTPGAEETLNVPHLQTAAKSVPTTPRMIPSKMYDDGVEEEITLPSDSFHQKNNINTLNSQTDTTNRPHSVLENVKKAYDPETFAQATKKVHCTAWKLFAFIEFVIDVFYFMLSSTS